MPLEENNPVVGFTCGVYDLFHAGHVLMLKECRENCDFLIVALNSAANLSADKNHPIFTLEERVEILRSCKFVDRVETYSSEEELEQLLSSIKPTVRFLGDDYTNKPITGKEYSERIYFTDRSHGKSTSSYIRQILDRYRR